MKNDSRYAVHESLQVPVPAVILGVTHIEQHTAVQGDISQMLAPPQVHPHGQHKRIVQRLVEELEAHRGLDL